MSTTLPDDDDAIADALADEMLDRAAAAFPGHTPEFLIRLASLWLRQATGTVPAGRPIQQERLGEIFGTSRSRIGQIEAASLAKLYRRHHSALAPLREEIEN